MFTKKSIRGISFGNIFVFILALVLPIVFSESAQAAGFQQAYVRLDRLKTATATTGMVCAKPATTSAVNVDVQVTFPTVAVTDFTLSTTAGDWATATTNIDGNAAWPGITAATPTISGQTVTWTYASNQTLTAGTLYCFRWTSTAALTTSAAGTNLVGNIKTRTTAAATIDSSDYSTAIVSNDQVVVTATVPATFSIVFGDGGDADADANTDSFTGNLSTSTTPTYGNTLTLTTNAASGWVVWVKSANAALNSLSTSGTITSPGSYDGTPENLGSGAGYILDVDKTTDSATAGTGTVTVNAEYNGTTADTGGHLDTTFNPVASASGVTDGDVLTLVEKAKISAIQKAAADYTDTLTVVASGLF